MDDDNDNSLKGDIIKHFNMVLFFVKRELW